MLRTVQEEGILGTGQPEVEAIELDPGIFPAEVTEDAMHSEEAEADLTDRELVPTAIAAHRAWGPVVEDLEAEEAEEAVEEVVAEVAVAAVADGADNGDDD